MTYDKENLKDKRKRLRKDCVGLHIYDLLDLVEQQDKEFIKELKKEFEDSVFVRVNNHLRKDLFERIDKLSGENK